jgi:hypothetical protein
MDSYDLDIYKGATFSLSLTLNDASGIPIDLTNYNLSGYLKFKYSDSGKLVDLHPLAIIPLISGNVSLSIPATGTSVLPVTVGVYDIELYHTGLGTVDKVLMGRARIHPEVTY